MNKDYTDKEPEDNHSIVDVDGKAWEEYEKARKVWQERKETAVEDLSQEKEPNPDKDHFQIAVGRKFDQEKPDWSLLDLDVVQKVVEVLTFGASKYSRNNWRLLADPQDRYLAACLRHITAWQKGEKIDEESGLPHLAHATCCLVFLMCFDKDDEAKETKDAQKGWELYREEVEGEV